MTPTPERPPRLSGVFALSLWAAYVGGETFRIRLNGFVLTGYTSDGVTRQAPEIAGEFSEPFGVTG